MRSSRPKTGDIFENSFDGNVYVMHLVLLGEPHGPFVRVYKGKEILPENLIIDKMGLGIIPAIKEGGWKLVGNVDPGHVDIGPMLRFDGAYPNNWYLMHDDGQKLLGKDVPQNLRHLDVYGICNYEVLEYRLLTGVNKYSYEKWMEYKEKYKEKYNL